MLPCNASLVTPKICYGALCSTAEKNKCGQTNEVNRASYRLTVENCCRNFRSC